MEIDALCVKYSAEARFSRFATCHKNDLVLFDAPAGIKAGKVHMHYEIEGVTVSLISVYDFVSKDSATGYSIWKATGAAQMIESSSILDTLVYCKLPNERLASILAIEFR